MHLGDSMEVVLSKNKAAKPGEDTCTLLSSNTFFDAKKFHIENEIVYKLEAIACCTMDPYGDFARTTLKFNFKATASRVFGG